ncbi:MAG: bifunctional proline dehydrogenase/L-glutamate gamma-semialdehyde dehydrogenase [Chlamydiales bacterium]|nr:bifunctional proline dehydrogenase/L-glutamate gamma-semialdehyde dehydrogenase [Chlamydiales bacterium]
MDNSTYWQQAKRLLDGSKGIPRAMSQRCEDSVALAAILVRWADEEQTRSEKCLQAQMARMMSDPSGKAFTTAMTDQCFRSRDPYRVADQLAYLINNYGVPRYLSLPKRIGIGLFKWLGKLLAPLLVPMVKILLRHDISRVIMPGEAKALSRHLKMRQEQGVRINLNHLGEAILGEEEAKHRLGIYLEDLAKPDVDYISVKISTICSQLNLLGWDRTLDLLSERLRELYRAAGVKFVNLDMEEYSDLALTVALFQKVLDEPEFLHYSAGIVLQAYIPDSFKYQQQLTEWSLRRIARGGAPVKIRIVKGANLGMERVISSLHEWPQAPYSDKADVDANFKRMVHYGMHPKRAHAVHLGIGSHNLFDISFALLLRAEYSLEHEVIFEMLEGMADHTRRVVQTLAGGMLLYCPAAAADEFQNAIAYLIRRLDENTAPQNFLRHAFELKPGSPAWNAQVELFTEACKKIDSVSSLPNRIQDRSQKPVQPPFDGLFVNESDTDWALEQNRNWIREVIQKPENWTRPELMNLQELEVALSRARTQSSAEERSQVLWKVAQVFRRQRSALMNVMVHTCSKTAPEADVEIQEAIDFVEYYRRNILELHQHKDIRWSPKGIVVVAPPWNFPCSIPVGGIAAALAAGNAVIFKPAPEAVEVGMVVAQAFWEGGIDQNALQLIVCEDEPVGSQLIKDPRVSAVILTGATATAKHLMKLRPGLDLLAETGGKNAIIVTRMADRDLAVRDIVQSAFGHSGQKCSACSLLICEAEVYDDSNFMDQLRDAAASWLVGPTTNLSTRLGPLIREPGPDLLRGLTTLEAGESWLLKPKQSASDPLLWSPGIKVGVTPGSFTFKTELFGPVLSVVRAENLSQAIEYANATPYGLTSGIHSLDRREIDQWRQNIEAGNLYINRGITGAVVYRQPFGGCKESSFGPGIKAGGPNYLINLMHADNLGTSDSYQYFWDSYFSRTHLMGEVVGQENTLSYRPVPVALRVQKGDSAKDIERVRSAAAICGSPLEVSEGGEDGNFVEYISKHPFTRVRLLQPPGQALQKGLWDIGARVIVKPVVLNGRIELLNYLREVAVSYDYHRYGNLGDVDAEISTPREKF